jgi:membrane AbrB-like protein
MVAILPYLLAGLVGGLIGMKIKMSGSVIICSMLAVIALKMILKSDMTVPTYMNLAIQIALGIMVGMGYSPELAKMFTQLVLPMLASTVVLVIAGTIMAIIMVKLGLMNISDAYLSTSPGAMSALLSLSLEESANPGIVAAFHFIRVSFIVLTAPLAFHLLKSFVSR